VFLLAIVNTIRVNGNCYIVYIYVKYYTVKMYSFACHIAHISHIEYIRVI